MLDSARLIRGKKDLGSGCCVKAAQPFVETDAAKSCFTERHERVLLDPTAPVSGVGVANDLPQVPNRLAPALADFSPTPEMPEIAKAQALLAVLAETNEVKGATAQRQRRLDLQMSYRRTLLWGKGFAAEETEAAFARVAEFAGLAETAAARFVAYYAQIQRNVRAEFRLARETAEVFLREAEAGGRCMEASIARRTLGMTLLFQGDLRLARSFLERALADFVPERDEAVGSSSVRTAKWPQRPSLRWRNGIWARSLARDN
jgi:hypothetical protein